MSYLSEPASTATHGVVLVGDNINVDEYGVISSPTILQGPGIFVDYDFDTITISATGADLIHVYGTSTNYTLTLDDEYVGINSVSAVTVTLPAGIDGRVYTIKDEHGQGSGKITIQSSVGETIDGKSNYVIGVPYQSINVVFRQSGWWII